MTALERAKAFVNSRAATTALRIMPLALATVVAVSDVPKAHATTVFDPSSGSAQWILPDCSGGATACLETKLDPLFPSNSPATASFNAFGSSGVQASGSVGGYHKNGSVDKPGNSNEVDLSLQVSGSGSGNYGTDATFGFSFLVTCPTTGCANTDTFSYDGTATIDGNPLAFAGTFTPGTAVTLPQTLIATNPSDSVSDPGLGWGATINFHWNGVDGENFVINPVDLNFNPNPGAPTVPEPASMLLALAGLPFLKRFIRKR